MLNGLSEDELRPLVEVIGGMQDEIDMMMAEGRPFFLLCLQNLLPYKTVSFSQALLHDPVQYRRSGNTF